MDTKLLPFRLIIAIALISAAFPIGLVMPVQAQSADNLLVNGGFETGSTAPWEGIDSAQITNGSAYSGNYAAKITSQKEASQGWITVTPGNTYELTAWFKWVEFTGSNWGYDRIQIVGNDWSEIAVAGKFHSQFPQNSWDQVKLTFTPKTSAVRVIFGLFGPQDKVEFYFDEFQLKQTGSKSPETSPTDNLLTNGDFENGSAPWLKISNTNVVEGNAQSGTHAVKISANLEAETDWIKVDPTKTYEYTAWFKWNEFSGTNWGFPRLQVVNSDWSEAGVVNRLHTLYPKGQYSEIKLVFKPKTDKVRVLFGQFGPQDRSELYFDNLSLKVQGSVQPTTTPVPTQTATSVQPTAPQPTAVQPTAVQPTAVQPTATKAPAQPTATNAPVQPTTAPAGPNLVTNGDFEAASVSPWTGLSSSNLVSSGAYSGSKAIRITSATEARQLWVTVEPGKPYTVSAWFKWVDFTGSNWGYPRIQVVNYDWSEAGAANALQRAYPKGAWSQVNINVTPKSDKIGIIFGQFGPQDRIDLYFDAFSVIKTGSSPVPTAVQPTAGAPTATQSAPTATPVQPTPTKPPTNPPSNQLPGVRTVNMPYLNAANILNERYTEMAIFWFGKVTTTENYTDVRIAYNDKGIVIKANVFDRLFNYDTAANLANLMKNDAVSIYLNMGDPSSQSVNNKTYRFTGGLNWWEDHSRYQAGYQGNNGTWQSSTVSFSSLQGYAGAQFNNSIETAAMR